MELSKANIRIHNYVRNSLRYSQKQAEELYISKFNPFYKWVIGNSNDNNAPLSRANKVLFDNYYTFEAELRQIRPQKIEAFIKEEQIKTSVLIYFAEKVIPKSLENGNESIKAFTILLNSVKKFLQLLKLTSPENLTIKDWAEIRKDYTQEIKKEWDHIFNSIEFFENEGYDQSGKDFDQINPGVGLDSGIITYPIDELDEFEIIELFNDQLLNILENIFLGNWLVRIKPDPKQEFYYKVAIFNLHLPINNLQQIFLLAQKMLQNYFNSNYGENEWHIKNFQTNTYIEGSFFIKK